jgi:adenosylmethionine-8-amino-7-oxononanoate aminotransferase
MLRPELARLDRTRVWHPYSPMPGTVAPLVVESASGVTAAGVGS